MGNKTIHVNIVSAERELFSEDVNSVCAPALLGEVGILPGHAPFVSILGPGEVRVCWDGGREQSFYVSSGLLEVQPELVTVLSDSASRAEDLDEAAVAKAKEAAERAFQNRDAGLDYAKVQAQLAEAVAQWQTIQHLRRRSRS